MRKAVQQVYWNWYYHRSTGPKLDVSRKSISMSIVMGFMDIAVYCGDVRSPGNVSQLLCAFYDLKRFGIRDLSEYSFVAKTGNNENALNELSSYLEKETYPVLDYVIEVVVGSLELSCRITH